MLNTPSCQFTCKQTMPLLCLFPLHWFQITIKCDASRPKSKHKFVFLNILKTVGQWGFIFKFFLSHLADFSSPYVDSGDSLWQRVAGLTSLVFSSFIQESSIWQLSVNLRQCLVLVCRDSFAIILKLDAMFEHWNYACYLSSSSMALPRRCRRGQ